MNGVGVDVRLPLAQSAARGEAYRDAAGAAERHEQPRQLAAGAGAGRENGRHVVLAVIQLVAELAADVLDESAGDGSGVLLRGGDAGGEGTDLGESGVHFVGRPETLPLQRSRQSTLDEAPVGLHVTGLGGDEQEGPGRLPGGEVQELQEGDPAAARDVLAGYLARRGGHAPDDLVLVRRRNGDTEVDAA